jgi:hypothetical protein
MRWRTQADLVGMALQPERIIAIAALPSRLPAKLHR